MPAPLRDDADAAAGSARRLRAVFTALRRLQGPAVIALAVALAPHPSASTAPVGQFDRGSWTPPGEGLRLVQERQYRMAGRIRPLLFWISSENVGGGTLRWKSDGGATAYEILIGTDPARAPKGLNRWGYLAEETRNGETRVLGLISESEESSLTDVQSDQRQPGLPFKTVRATVTSTQSRALVSTIRAPVSQTYRDVQQMLDRVLSGSDLSKPREAARPPDVRPGFLFAVAELIRTGAPTGTRTRYIYCDAVYELRITSRLPLERLETGSRTYEHLTQTRFEIHDSNSAERWRFELVYRTDGDLAGVPVLINYRPRWWLEVALYLEE
jgi:hypothetical protein